MKVKEFTRKSAANLANLLFYHPVGRRGRDGSVREHPSDTPFRVLDQTIHYAFCCALPARNGAACWKRACKTILLLRNFLSIMHGLHFYRKLKYAQIHYVMRRSV